jgi:phage protein U
MDIKNSETESNDESLTLSSEENEKIDRIYGIFNNNNMHESLTDIRKNGARKSKEVMNKIKKLNEDMKELQKQINNK